MGTIVKRGLHRRGETAWWQETESFSLTVRVKSQRSLCFAFFKEFAFEDRSILLSPWDNFFFFFGGELHWWGVFKVTRKTQNLNKKCEQQKRLLGQITLMPFKEKLQRFKNECSWIFWCLAQFPKRNYVQLQLRTKYYSVVCSWIFWLSSYRQ